MSLEPDAETCERLRAVAEDLRATDEEGAEGLAAIVHRVSDLYDEGEETTVQEIHVAVRHMYRVKERGGLRK